MGNVRHGFEKNTIVLSTASILPTRVLPSDHRKTAKFKAILASVREVGVIEPLVVFPETQPGESEVHHILLDGHLRLEALKALNRAEVACIISTDDEGFTYNRQVNRLSTIQEHNMIRRAIDKGVSEVKIASALNVDVKAIRERRNLLDKIAPEAVELLKNKHIAKNVFGSLRKMKPMRQIEAAEMMISANRFTYEYARMLVAATRPEHLVNGQKAKPRATIALEDIARMEREMEKVHQDYRLVEDTLGESMLVLVVAKGYVGRLFKNPAISGYLERHHQDLASELKAIIQQIAMDARNIARE